LARSARPTAKPATSRGAGQVGAGHLGSLAADEGAAGDLAAVGDAGDNLRDLLGAQVAGGDVVEEDQWHAAGDSHGH